MTARFIHSILKALSGLSINLSAGWFGAILIVPNFSPIKTSADFLTLIYDFIFGTIFLGLTVWFEYQLQK